MFFRLKFALFAWLIRSDKRLYDIACLLRGPDSNSQGAFDLKWAFTARIRYVLGLSHDFAAVRDTRWTLSNDASLVPMKSEFGTAHYLDHAKLAISALEARGLIVDHCKNKDADELSYILAMVENRLLYENS